MTDFRHVRGLRVHSGGTVRDFHPVLYSPSGPEGIRTALELSDFNKLWLHSIPIPRKSQPSFRKPNRDMAMASRHKMCSGRKNSCQSEAYAYMSVELDRGLSHQVAQALYHLGCLCPGGSPLRRQGIIAHTCDETAAYGPDHGIRRICLLYTSDAADD